MAGKKKRDVETINYALIAKPHTPMYLMHKYWARKPHNVVAEYIKHYSKEGDIVLDPFCGSGVTAIESIKHGRKTIGIDLDPMSTFITRMTAIPADIDKIKKTFKEIQNSCKKEIEDLYKTKCKKCGSEALIICTHWEHSTPIKIYYFCSNCKKKWDKGPDEDDLKLIKKIEKQDIPYWYPKIKLYYDGHPFLKKEKNEYLSDLFTKRNLMSLTILFEHISKLKDDKIREIFNFAFTSLSHLASKLTPVRPTRPMSSFWAIQSFWVPPLFMESNVWHLFESAIYGPQGIIEGKTDSNSQIQHYKEAKKFNDLNDGANILIKAHNALELRDIIPENSIDYVFTDPPYGGAVQYFELSTLWASWLKMDLDYKDEITINTQQEKDFEYYHKMLRAAFKEVYRVLKPGKYLTVTFHSTDIKVWNSIIKAVVNVGFDLEKIVYQPPARASAKGLLQPYGSAVGDYYIRFRKPETETLRTDKEIDMKTYELEVVESAKGIIMERGEPTMYQHILNGIMVDLKGGRYVPVGAKNIDEILKGHIGKEFELIAVYDSNGKKAGKKWWLKGVDISHFTQPSLSDRVEKSVIQVLDSSIKVSFDDVLQAIFIEYPNALTPEAEKIKDILEQYAEKTNDGKWRLKPDVKLSLSLHNKIIYLLAKLGKKIGFDIWIGRKEQAESYNNENLSELVTNKRPTWRYVNTHSWDRVDMIDVIWHEQGRIAFEFEVENTTAITDALSRGSNIPPNHLKRILVIPQEREAFLSRKMKDPMIAENVQKFDWKFLFYRDIEDLSAKKKDVLTEMEKLFKIPKENAQTQDSLKKYL
ncbi:MAG: hypothetical protein KJ955_08635 [Nanoarchaeota archaeon]|nr:hypothetical protein [Nanoarchaeota archaeon]